MMKVLIAGDFCPQDRVAKAFDNEDYGSVLDNVRDIISNVNYSIVNFECPKCTKEAKPIEKIGPNLKCNENSIKAIKYAGFNCVTLANNHFRDFGDIGITETISSLKSMNVEYVGGGECEEEASKTLYKTIANEKIAIINCCEHEFSIATSNHGGANPLNPISQYYAIKKAKKQADYVLVIVHGGHEMFQLPSPRMLETYRFFIDAGANAVVNHHQHCFSGYEIYNGAPIFYGLGNFCFDNPSYHSGIWTEGYAITIDFSVNNTSFETHPYIQCADIARVELLESNAYDGRIKDLNSIINNPNKYNKEISDYYLSCSNIMSRIFEPLFNRFYIGGKRRGWFPSLISKKRKLAAIDYILCEAHRDKLINWLDNNN